MKMYSDFDSTAGIVRADGLFWDLSPKICTIEAQSIFGNRLPYNLGSAFFYERNHDFV